jgi:hypothetical protein
MRICLGGGVGRAGRLGQAGWVGRGSGWVGRAGLAGWVGRAGGAGWAFPRERGHMMASVPNSMTRRAASVMLPDREG